MLLVPQQNFFDSVIFKSLKVQKVTILKEKTSNASQKISGNQPEGDGQILVKFFIPQRFLCCKLWLYDLIYASVHNYLMRECVEVSRWKYITAILNLEKKIIFRRILYLSLGKNSVSNLPTLTFFEKKNSSYPNQK